VADAECNFLCFSKYSQLISVPCISVCSQFCYISTVDPQSFISEGTAKNK
jgi:hypothetical protein